MPVVRTITLLLAVYQRYKKTTARELVPLICYKPMIEIENINVKSKSSFEIWIFCSSQPDCDYNRTIVVAMIFA